MFLESRVSSIEFCNGLSNLVGEFSSHLMELASQEAQFRLHLNEKLGQRISVGQQIEESTLRLNVILLLFVDIAQVNSTIHSFLHSLGMSIPPSTDDMDE